MTAKKNAHMRFPPRWLLLLDKRSTDNAYGYLATTTHESWTGKDSTATAPPRHFKDRKSRLERILQPAVLILSVTSCYYLTTFFCTSLLPSV